MSKNYSPRIKNAVETYLDNDDWKYRFDEEGGFFEFNLTMGGKIGKIKYYMNIGAEDYTVRANLSTGADKDDPKGLAAVAEYITRANYGLRDGCFQMDYRDGEIGYRTYVNCADGVPGKNTIKDSIYLPAAMVKRYGEPLLRVIYAGTDPEEEIRKAEED